jgi:hypothetical protein
MATTYYADNYGTQTQIASDGSDFSQYFKFTVPAAGFIINDLVYLASIPAGVVLLEWLVNVPDIDTSTGAAIQLGDTGTADLFMAAATTAPQSGGIVSTQVSGVLGAVPKSYSAANAFILKVSTAPTTTATTGTFSGWVRYNMIGVRVLV